VRKEEWGGKARSGGFHASGGLKKSTHSPVRQLEVCGKTTRDRKGTRISPGGEGLSLLHRSSRKRFKGTGRLYNEYLARWGQREKHCPIIAKKRQE